jgi:hypothetical protein
MVRMEGVQLRLLTREGRGGILRASHGVRDKLSRSERKNIEKGREQSSHRGGERPEVGVTSEKGGKDNAKRERGEGDGDR